jgi:hypothetical protein
MYVILETLHVLHYYCKIPELPNRIVKSSQEDVGYSRFVALRLP